MATLKLPMPTTYNESIRVGLEGTTYEFRYLWNERDNHWFLDLLDVEGNYILAGVRIVIGWDLLINVPSGIRPPGSVYFFDLSTNDATVTGEDPRQDDLGDRVQGYYVESG